MYILQVIGDRILIRFIFVKYDLDVVYISSVL